MKISWKRVRNDYFRDKLSATLIYNSSHYNSSWLYNLQHSSWKTDSSYFMKNDLLDIIGK